MMRQIEFRRDGYLVAKRLRELSETRASCLIALTGYGQPADRERARDAGFDHLLTKPADPDALLALVDAWIESAATPRAAGQVEEIAYGDGVKQSPSVPGAHRSPVTREHHPKYFFDSPPLITLCITRLRSPANVRGCGFRGDANF